MKLIINNVEFPFDFGCKLLKLKHEQCPMPQLAEFWGDIKQASFKEIAGLPNLEQRRVGMLCLGLERMIKEVNPTLLNEVTLDKSTTWITENGEVVEHKFKDTYKLFKVSADYFNEGVDSWRKMKPAYYISCKDTSTDREYLIWVDLESVYRANNDNTSWGFSEDKVNAIDCVAWTFQTNLVKGSIEKIIRQGDCILFKPKSKYETLNRPRHLTSDEYRTLLVAES
jgi:hypothetical protein